MGKRKSAQDWNAFLRGVRRTGNARVAAAAAGMDVGTAYDRRIKDARFAARWDAALAMAKAREERLLARRGREGGGTGSGGGRAGGGGGGEELVARRTRNGTQMVRAAAGRWSAGAEAAFLATLRRTGCVRASARACGLSTTALYRRRANYPAFARAWAAAEAEAKERIPALLNAATIASLDPEIDDGDLPHVDVGQAIAIARLKCGPGAERRGAVPEPPIEEVRASILRKLDSIEAHAARQAAKRGG